MNNRLTLYTQKIIESLLTGISEIYYNKMRSLLTMLGITLGVVSLISMVGIIEGAKRNSIAIMNQYGGLNKISFKYIDSQSLIDAGVYKVRGLTLDDVKALMKSHAYIIQAISPMIDRDGFIKRSGKSLSMYHMLGVTPAFNEVNQYAIASGRPISMMDDYSLARVCIIGTLVKNELFDVNENPIGKEVMINGVKFRVIGVYEHYQMRDSFRPASVSNVPKVNKNIPERAIKKSKSQEGGRSSRTRIWEKYGKDNALWMKNYILTMPFSTMQIIFKENKNIDNIDILLKDSEGLTEQVDQMKATLKMSRGSAVEDFKVETAAERFEMMDKQIGIFNVVLGSIAVISLIVGGIGIMNVILASISERIREIGVRKSVGASNLDIFLQFLIETTVLSFVGGLIGVILSFGVVTLIARFSGLPAVISIGAISLALVFSSLVGIIFGIYPSIKAAKLNPITALRYE